MFFFFLSSLFSPANKITTQKKPHNGRMFIKQIKSEVFFFFFSLTDIFLPNTTPLLILIELSVMKLGKNNFPIHKTTYSQKTILSAPR